MARLALQDVSVALGARDVVSNVSVEVDPAGNLKPSKKVSTERIDGAVALIMAIDLAERNQAPPITELAEWL